MKQVRFQEMGSNLYGFVGNRGINKIDYMGLAEIDVTYPNATSIVPTINDTGGSGTSFSHTLICSCECDKKGAYILDSPR